MSMNRQVLETLKGINTAYGLDNTEIDKTLMSMRDAKVNLPVIGKFSSGKSAVLNTLLAKKLLRENITPETAVPAELSFSPSTDSVRIIYYDGRTEEIGLAQYCELETDASAVRCVRLSLHNDFLSRIPDILLVDMPGFESGYAVHNKAIDNYLPQSLAYVVAFPADDLILRESVEAILKELHLYDMPVAVVVTKYDKRNDDFDLSLQKLVESLKRVTGSRELPVLKTSAFDRSASELEEYLIQMQKRSGELLEKRFRGDVNRFLDAAETFLKTSLRSSTLGDSQLKEEEERLHQQLKDLNTTMQQEKDRMEGEVSGCAELIITDVQTALEAEEDTLVTLLYNRANIGDRVNSIVRRAVMESVKRHMIPVVERYLSRVSSGFYRLSAGEIQIDVDFQSEKIKKGMSSTMVGTAAYSVIDALGVVSGLLKALVVAVATLINSLINVVNQKKIKDEIRAKLIGETIPQILAQMKDRLEHEIENQIAQINADLEKRIEDRRAAIDKALSDLKQKINGEAEEKERRKKGLERDLNELSVLRSKLTGGSSLS